MSDMEFDSFLQGFAKILSSHQAEGIFSSLDNLERCGLPKMAALWIVRAGGLITQEESEEITSKYDGIGDEEIDNGWQQLAFVIDIANQLARMLKDKDGIVERMHDRAMSDRDFHLSLRRQGLTEDEADAMHSMHSENEEFVIDFLVEFMPDYESYFDGVHLGDGGN